MINRKYFNGLSALLFLATVLFSGCQYGNPITPDDKTFVDNEVQSEPLRVGVHSYPSSLFWYIAEDMGYFDEENANVQITYYDSISDYVEAMNKGELDIIGLGYMDLFMLVQQGMNLKTIVAADYSYGADAIVSRKGMNIDSIQDLKGKRIGVETETVSEFFLDYVLTNRTNIDLNDVEKVRYTALETVQAFKNREVDVICTFDPFTYSALEDENAQIIFDSSNERGLIADVGVVEESKLEANRDEYLKAVRAWLRAVDYFKNDPDAAAEIIAKRTDISKEDLLSQLDHLYILDLRDNTTAFSVGAGFESLYGSGKLILDFYKSRGIDSGLPTIDETLDGSLIKQIAEEGL